VTGPARDPQATADWYLYVVRAGDGSLYTGIATDVGRRLAEHAGTGARGARYLRGRAPVQLVYERRLGSHALALRAEHRLKRLSKSAKERLIVAAPDTATLLELLAVDPSDQA